MPTILFWRLWNHEVPSAPLRQAHGERLCCPARGHNVRSRAEGISPRQSPEENILRSLMGVQGEAPPVLPLKDWGVPRSYDRGMVEISLTPWSIQSALLLSSTANGKSVEGSPLWFGWLTTSGRWEVRGLRAPGRVSDACAAPPSPPTCPSPVLPRASRLPRPRRTCPSGYS